MERRRRVRGRVGLLVVTHTPSGAVVPPDLLFLILSGGPAGRRLRTIERIRYELGGGGAGRRTGGLDISGVPVPYRRRRRCR